MKKTTIKLFGAAKISHDKKVAEEKKHKASIASMKSRAKRLAAMNADELQAWHKKQSEASCKSYAKRIAAMTDEQKVAYNKKKAEASKRCRAKKIAAAEIK